MFRHLRLPLLTSMGIAVMLAGPSAAAALPAVHPLVQSGTITITATVPLSDTWRAAIVRHSEITLEPASAGVTLHLDLRGLDGHPLFRQTVLIETIQAEQVIAQQTLALTSAATVVVPLPVLAASYRVSLVTTDRPLQLHERLLSI